MKQALYLGPGLLLYSFFSAWVASWLKIQKEYRTAYSRKAFHFLIFTMAGILHLIGGLPYVTLFGGIVTLLVVYACYKGTGFAFYEALARETDRPHRRLFILIPLATTILGGIIINIFFQQFAFVGYIVSGWGDAIGEPVGAMWGSHPYKVPSLAGVPAHRTMEGSIAVAVVGMLGAMVTLALAHLPLVFVVSAAMIIGLASTGIEAISTHGLDNLTVQVGAAGIAYLLHLFMY